MQNEIYKNIEYLLKVEEGGSALLQRLETEVDRSLSHDAPLTAMLWTSQILEALRYYPDQPTIANQLGEVMERIATEFSAWIIETFSDGSSQRIQSPAAPSVEWDQNEGRSFIENFDDLPNWGVSKWPYLQGQVDLIATLASASPASLTRAVAAFGQMRSCFEKLPSNRQEQVLAACNSLVLAIREAMESMMNTMEERKGQ